MVYLKILTMPDKRALLFCKIAVANKLITQAGAEECLTLQDAYAMQGVVREIGQILVEKGELTDEQVRRVLDAQRRLELRKQDKPLQALGATTNAKSPGSFSQARRLGHTSQRPHGKKQFIITRGANPVPPPLQKTQKSMGRYFAIVVFVVGLSVIGAILMPDDPVEEERKKSAALQREMIDQCLAEARAELATVTSTADRWRLARDIDRIAWSLIALDILIDGAHALPLPEKESYKRQFEELRKQLDKLRHKLQKLK